MADVPMADDMKKDSDEETEVAAEEASNGPQRRLLESTLWKEDVFPLDHRTAWGTWYNKENKRWGYGCCKVEDKNAVCTNVIVKEGKPAHGAGESSSSHPEDESPESLGPDEVVIISWANPPAKLLTPEEVSKSKKDSQEDIYKKYPRTVADNAAFVEHFVRYGVGQWQRKATDSYAGFKHMEAVTFGNKGLLENSLKGLEVLLRRLLNPKELDRSEKEVRKGRETRAGMEGKVQKEKNVLEQISNICKEAAQQDYLGAQRGYMRLTLGNKTWNNTFVTHVAACTMKGAREYRRNRDNFNTYDMDPDSQKYMHALLKLVMLLQCTHPNPDVSKHVPF
mmetsp:Transcript_15456/g.24706  ORF Transcript_15456/g.24706 Transcript_15456/m.24706 type:complete len:337 (-) Transcript_15456:74-1084(-)